MSATLVTKAWAGPAHHRIPQHSPLSPRRVFIPLGNEADGNRAQSTSAQNRTATNPAASPSWDFGKTPIHPPDRAPGNDTALNSAEKGSGWRASSDLWYLDGAHGSRQTPTKVTLATDADRGGDLVWRVSEGADKARLAGADPATGRLRRSNDNRVELESLAPSSGKDDVVVEATRLRRDGIAVETRSGRLGVRSPAGTRQVSVERVRSSRAAAYPGPADPAVTSAAAVHPPEQQRQSKTETNRPLAAPHHLNARGAGHAVDPTYSYVSRITYQAIDDRGTPINGFSVNEQWPGGVVNDDPTCTWRRGPPGGYPSPTTMFSDVIQGEAAGMTPAPTAPGSPLGSHATQHWLQDWYIGSTTPGTGTKVQSNTLQKYQDHATHTNIKSPP